MYLRRYFILSFIIVITLIGCNKEQPVTERMYDHLEQAVTLESDYSQYQKEISELESQEQEIYEQITELTNDQFDEIQSLASDALETIKQRQEKLELEKEGIQASKDEFLKITALLEEIEEEDVKASAQEMYDQMIDRYDIYDDLYESYTNALKLEQQLYEMLQSEDTTHEETTLHIEEVNSSYEQVLTLNEAFNEAITKYNELKKDFYSTANMNVKYEED